MRAVLAETTTSPTESDKHFTLPAPPPASQHVSVKQRFSNTFEEIMEDDTAEFDTFARQIEEMTKSNDYSEEREFGDLPPLKSSCSSDLYGCTGPGLTTAETPPPRPRYA